MRRRRIGCRLPARRTPCSVRPKRERCPNTIASDATKSNAERMISSQSRLLRAPWRGSLHDDESGAERASVAESVVAVCSAAGRCSPFCRQRARRAAERSRDRAAWRVDGSDDDDEAEESAALASDGHWVYASRPARTPPRRPSSGRPADCSATSSRRSIFRATSHRHQSFRRSTTGCRCLFAGACQILEYGPLVSGLRGGVDPSRGRLRPRPPPTTLSSCTCTCRPKICSTAGATRWRRTSCTRADRRSRCSPSSSRSAPATRSSINSGSASRTTAPPARRARRRASSTWASG